MVLKVVNINKPFNDCDILGTGNRVMQDISKGNFVESAGAKGSTRGREREEANG